VEFKVKVDGIPLHFFQLNRHRQRLESGVLTIKKETSIESAPIQSIVGRKDLEKYLMAEVSIPAFDPVIQKKSREIVGDKNDLWERAKAVHQFVYSHLEKDPYVSLPDAIEALQTAKGDCNEHAALYTALARAAGVPARTVVGLVYSDSFYEGGKPGFYYHAWVEVFTGKQWVAIDPTWNQIPADVTHLAFIEGGADQQIQIAAVMGKVKLSLVDSKAVR
ncbi:MAG: transglutaminase-like domain-containing protein, partial [Bdellovibrionota bacterium]